MNVSYPCIFLISGHLLSVAFFSAVPLMSVYRVTNTGCISETSKKQSDSGYFEGISNSIY